MTTPRAIWDKLSSAFRWPDPALQRAGLDAFFAPDARVEVVHPINSLTGPEEVRHQFFDPLAEAFEGLIRFDQIAMESDDWIAATGYYQGRFTTPWLGLKPTGAMAFLRTAEFHRMNDAGQAVESYIFLDIPELMIASGQWPGDIPSPATKPGYTGALPGPMAQDGLDRARGDGSAALAQVEAMLLALATPDEAWRPYWHDHMVWYGPGAFGSFSGIEDFAAFQTPFEGCFSSWVGGSRPGSETRHFTRFGEGRYVCSGGWPSLNAHQVRPFLGQPTTDKTLYMRVCDFWTQEDGKLLENWVFVDIPHVLRQMGRDLFAEAA